MVSRDNNHFARRFAEAVKRHRKKQQLSHEKLAERAGVTRPTVSDVEACNVSPTLGTCYKIATALGIKLSELIRDAE